MRLINVALVAWAAFWIGIAAYTAYEVSALRSLSATVVKAGAATESTGHALAALNGVPFVGSEVGRLAQQAIAAGASARASGAASGSTIDRLAVLLGIAIALIPTLPFLSLYIPLRMSWRRDRKALQRAVAQWDGETGLEAFLAQRALAHLPFHELRGLGWDGDPGSSASTSNLATAELKRMGINRARR